jgi:hypothetical protein
MRDTSRVSSQLLHLPLLSLYCLLSLWWWWLMPLWWQCGYQALEWVELGWKWCCHGCFRTCHVIDVTRQRVQVTKSTTNNHRQLQWHRSRPSQAKQFQRQRQKQQHARTTWTGSRRILRVSIRKFFSFLFFPFSYSMLTLIYKFSTRIRNGNGNGNHHQTQRQCQPPLNKWFSK